jgi:RNA polymerase sigma factor (sigma-70 family)
MSDVTRILSQIHSGDPAAAQQLLPLVYDELRKLAAAKMAHENPGHTLQATALVHEAYLRLVGGGKRSEVGSQKSEPESPASDLRPPTSDFWHSRGHFFAAAAEAMRRILTDAARRKQTAKHGGQARRLPDAEIPDLGGQHDPVELLAVNELLDRLAERHPRKAQVVKLRYFLGCTQEEAAQILDITPAAAQEDWVFARAWLKREWRRAGGDSCAEKQSA